MDTRSNSEITIATMKWNPPDTDSGKRELHSLYSSEMVNGLYRDLQQNVKVPFKFVCITDDPSGLNEGIEARPLPTKLQGLEESWAKVFLFSPDMEYILGERFCYIDMDAIVTGDITPLLQLDNEMVVTRFCSNKESKKSLRRVGTNKAKLCNTCFYVMNAGCASWVWHDFNLQWALTTHQTKPEHLRWYKGSDQAWVSYCLHKNFILGDIRIVGPDSGLFEFKRLDEYEYEMPNFSRVIFFGGNDHPYDTGTRNKAPWVKEFR